MGNANRVITKVHRVAAGLLLLLILPAGYASSQGGQPELLVYLPLAPLFVLIITGTYQLVLPWVRKARAKRAGDAQP